MKSLNSNFSGAGVASIAINTMYLIGTRWFNQAVRLIYAIALAHYLGPELYGLICYGISWYLTFLPLTGFGIAAILSREIGRERNSGPRITSLTLTLRSSTAIIAAVTSGILGWFFETRPDVRIILIVFSIALVGRSIDAWTGAVFNAYEVNRFTFRIQAVFRTLECVVGTALLIGGGGAMAVALVHAISWWLQALSGLELIRRRIVTIRLNWSWHELRDLIAKGLPLGFEFFMMTWLQTGVLVLFRHIAGSGNSLGQLALAMQAFVVMSSISTAAGMASLPVLSRSVARQDGKDLFFIMTSMKATFIFGGVAGLTALGGGPWLVDLIFGTRYIEAGHLLGLVMWLFIPFTCAITIGRVYLAMEQYLLLAVCSGAGALVFTLTVPWLVSFLDTKGAVIAAGAGMVVWASILLWSLARSGELDVYQTVFRSLLMILMALGVFYTLRPVNALLALIMGWGTLLSGALLFGVITKDEQRDLLMHLKRRWSSS